MSSVVHLLLNL